MKYMMMGNYRTPTFTRLTILGSLLFLVLFWGTNFLMYFRNMGLDPQSVALYYLGNEEEFSMPRTYGAMLEVTHAHFAMMAVVLLLVTHLALFFPWSLRVRVALVIGCFGGALVGESAGWLVRYVSADLAFLKIVGFLSLQISLGILLGGLAWFLRPGQTDSIPGMPPMSAPRVGAKPSPPTQR